VNHLHQLNCADNEIAKFNGGQWVCAADVDTDTNTDTLGALTCGAGQVPKFNGTQWECADDADTVTEDSDTLADLNCTTDQIAKFDGVQWVCSEDGTAALQAKVERLIECARTDRYLDLGLTVFDCETWLEWEKKTDDGGIHDKDNRYSWSMGGPLWNFDGTAKTEFIDELNDLAGGGMNCFAGHCDWRLPEVNRDGATAELETILSPCPGGGVPCIDETIFGPTAASFYWSATPLAGIPSNAWLVGFSIDGDIILGDKSAIIHVRAVRSGP
jgi:hypothetical protein